MEFTFEGPTADKLYILQTRDMAIRGRKEVLKFDLERNPPGTMLLGHGIGVVRRCHGRDGWCSAWTKSTAGGTGSPTPR